MTPAGPAAHSHYREVCAIHGTTLAQCRCASPDKADRTAPCPGPPRCPLPPGMVQDIQKGAAFAVRAIPAVVKLANAQRANQGATLTPDEVRAVVEMLQLLAQGAKEERKR